MQRRRTFNAKVQETMAQVKESYEAKIVAASKEAESSAKASKYQLRVVLVTILCAIT